MAAYINAPLCSYPGTVLPIHEESYQSYKKHLSDTTIAEFPKAIAGPAPKPKTNTTINRFSKETATTRRSSQASSYSSPTKSQLMETNKRLIEMLQAMQTELASHKAMMLDLQSRISLLEHDAAGIEEEAPAHVSPVLLEQLQLDLPSPVIPAGRESMSWWEACRNFADNCDTPFSAQEFLKTPGDYDEFDFHFGGLVTNPSVVNIGMNPDVEPASPPAVADLPSLTPTSDRDEQSQSSSPILSPQEVVEDLTLISTSEDGFEYDDIVERIVEFSKPRTLRPLLLHPPPTGKSTSDLDMGITALPQFPAETEAAEPSKRHSKGIRGMFNYKKLSRTRSSEGKGKHYALLSC
jgi:hypothetical protein